MLHTAVSIILIFDRDRICKFVCERACPHPCGSSVWGMSCGGVFFLSTLLAGCFWGDCVLSWTMESSDDSAIDVSHSNSMCVLSLRNTFFLGCHFLYDLAI